jgi:hypothetical protein
MRILHGTILALFMTVPTAAFAQAPKLSEGMARNTNDLQRAAWACEGGASSFESGKAAGNGARFFLGTVDASGNRNEPPLILKGNSLSGLGSLSDGKGWFNIKFDCTLSADLRQPTAFKFETLNPIPASTTSPQPSVARTADGDEMKWTAQTGDSARLVHGVPETDRQDFYAGCSKGRIEVQLQNTVSWLKAGTFASVSISDGSLSGLYVAKPVMDDESGAFIPVISLDAKDPLPQWIARGNNLHINIAAESVYDVPLRGSAQAAKTFAAACH